MWIPNSWLIFVGFLSASPIGGGFVYFSYHFRVFCWVLNGQNQIGWATLKENKYGDPCIRGIPDSSPLFF